MKVFNKKVLFNLVIAGLSVMLMGGISASADELETVDCVADFDTYPTQYVDVYTPKKYTLTTVGLTDIQSPDGLSLKEYIVENARQCNETVDISGFNLPLNDAWKIGNILQEIKMEYPELFNLENSYSYNYSKAFLTCKNLTLFYNVSLDDYEKELKVVDDKFSEVIDSITDDMSDLEKALIVHDYICDNFAYDSTLTKHDMYSFVATGDGVCQAYMYSYAYILSKLGIKSYPVMSNEITHTWNMIELDGKYYQVDVTWDDFTPDLYGWASHDYFLLSDESISATKHGTKSDGNTDYGWYMFEDFSATDNTYDDYAFKNTTLPYVAVNGEVYNIDLNGIFYKYDANTNTSTNIAAVASDDVWYRWGGSIANPYTYKFSSLHAYKDVIVFNKANSICVMNTSGQIIDTPFTRQGNEDAIFGITIRNGNILAQVEPNLNTERDGYGTNIVKTFNIDEWYESHKDQLVVTTTEATTTTEETTTTTEETTTTTEETTTPVETTTVTERVPCVELEEPDYETLFGYVYPAFSNGVAQQWTPNGMSLDDTYPIIAQPVAITGNGDYSLTINIPDGLGSSSIQFLAMDSTLNSYQQNYLQQNIMDKMSWDITSIVVDGVEIPYTASSNSLIKGNDGSNYRKLIYDNWTGKNVKDIDPNIVNTKSIVINFTISGIKTSVEDTTTEATTTTTEPVTTTTEPETTTTEPITTTAPEEVTDDTVATTTKLEKVDNVKVEVAKEVDKDTGEEVAVAVAVITPATEDESLPEDVQVVLDGKQLDTSFFSYDSNTGKITFNTDVLKETFGEDVDLNEILNNVEVYSVTTAPASEKNLDVDGDGEVGADDLLIFKSEFKQLLRGKVSYDDIASCDVNGDGQINVIDLLEIKRQILGLAKK